MDEEVGLLVVPDEGLGEYFEDHLDLLLGEGLDDFAEGAVDEYFVVLVEGVPEEEVDDPGEEVDEGVELVLLGLQLVDDELRDLALLLMVLDLHGDVLFGFGYGEEVLGVLGFLVAEDLEREVVGWMATWSNLLA